jgi:sugar phosphate isomerase/epimerase
MIYVSSQCAIGANNIGEAVERLAQEGFTGIELSGGTKFYPEYREDLMRYKTKYKLQYLVHNYFPPTPDDFVLNLASLDNEIRRKSVELCFNAIAEAVSLGSPSYSVHAGFYFDPEINELGNIIKPRALFDQEGSIRNFLEAWRLINERAKQLGVTIYLENNVFNQASCISLGGKIPAMLLSLNDIVDFKKQYQDFNLLLDIGHLKVTARTLGADFENEFMSLVRISDYIHISNNNGRADEHKCVFVGSELYEILGGVNLAGKTIVLEMRDSMDKLKMAHEAMRKLSMKEPCNVR